MSESPQRRAAGRASLLALAFLGLSLPASVDARTIWRCVHAGSLSVSTAPEPGSNCRAVTLKDNASLASASWAIANLRRGVIYRREQGGMTVYGTRKLEGAVPVQRFELRSNRTLRPARGIGAPRIEVFKDSFRRAANSTGLDEAWLRAIAHVESGFNARALSKKGAMGIMQLMPQTARHLKVSDPFDPDQSIQAGARHLRTLSRRYDGDLVRVAAAYNAGAGAVDRYGGIPPYSETRAYVGKVMNAHQRYLSAMSVASKRTVSTTPQAPTR